MYSWELSIVGFLITGVLVYNSFRYIEYHLILAMSLHELTNFGSFIHI